MGSDWLWDQDEIFYESDSVFLLYLLPESRSGLVHQGPFPGWWKFNFDCIGYKYGTSFILLFGPFTRYYFGNARTKVFLHGGLWIRSNTYSYNYSGIKKIYSDFVLYFDLRAGIAFFNYWTGGIGSCPGLPIHWNQDEYSGSFWISAGLQIHISQLFNRNKVDDQINKAN